MVTLLVRMAGSRIPRRLFGVRLVVSSIQPFLASRPLIMVVIEPLYSYASFFRCDWTGPIVFTRSDLWQPVVVLPGWPGGCRDHVSPGPSLEGSEPCLLAGCLWSDEPGPTGYGSQFLLLVGDQHDLQWVDTTSQACVVV